MVWRPSSSSCLKDRCFDYGWHDPGIENQSNILNRLGSSLDAIIEFQRGQIVMQREQVDAVDALVATIEQVVQDRPLERSKTDTVTNADPTPSPTAESE